MLLIWFLILKDKALSYINVLIVHISNKVLVVLS